MKKLPPVAIILISFLATILVGTLIFKLPISLQEGKSITWMDSFFLSTSAITTTGLVTFSNIGATLSVFGKIVLAIFTQIGGLGCTTIATFFFLAIGAKLGIGNRYLLKEALNQDKVSNVLKLLKSIIKITLIIELFGAIVNFIVFSKYFDIGSAIGISLFHSISAFNNAGFDILGDNSLINYGDNILLNVNTMLISLLGGLGFIVIADLLKNKFNLKKLKIHSKIVLTMTFSLLISSTLLLKLSMGNNINWLQAVFHSVSASTAGFATINCATLVNAAALILSILMVIGGSPASTGGGIKTTTVYTMIKSMISFARGKPTIVNNRKISEESKLKAFTLFFFVVTFIGVCVVAILIIESNNESITTTNVLFEACSAFSTAGLSMGITSNLTIASKFILCLLMYVGRIGPITIMGMWNTNWNKPNINNVEYLEEKIIIG